MHHLQTSTTMTSHWSITTIAVQSSLWVHWSMTTIAIWSPIKFFLKKCEKKTSVQQKQKNNNNNVVNKWTWLHVQHAQEQSMNLALAAHCHVTFGRGHAKADLGAGTAVLGQFLSGRHGVHRFPVPFTQLLSTACKRKRSVANATRDRRRPRATSCWGVKSLSDSGSRECQLTVKIMHVARGGGRGRTIQRKKRPKTHIVFIFHLLHFFLILHHEVFVCVQFGFQLRKLRVALAQPSNETRSQDPECLNGNK